MAAGDAVQQIKERLSIEEVVAPYVELHKAGKNFKGKSPFTNEKTPSFYVSPDRGMYYCFSSSQGGDIFTFIEKMEGVDFKEALKILADKAGVELVPEDPKKKTARDRQYEVLNEATSFFEQYLTKKSGASEYLKKRSVTPETIAKWRIGYAPGPPDHGWREGKEYLESKGYTKEELGKAGLIKGFDTGKEPYDLFRDRVMFPIFDSAGHVVAFSGRALTKDDKAPKYVNSPETELFNKSEILYGYHQAKQGIRNMDFSLCVEGQFDVVLAHQAGYVNTVAVSGTALTAHHVGLLQRLSNRVVLALDADRAGISAVKRAAELMLARGMDVKVARMPDGADPADMVSTDLAEFKKIIGHSTHVIEYLLDVLESTKKDDRTFKLKAREEILPYVVLIPNFIDREHFENLIAERLGTTKDAVHAEIMKLEEKKEIKKEDTVVVNETFIAPVKTASNMMESYAEQVFGALKFLEQFTEHAHVHANIHSHLEAVLGGSFEAVQADMNDDRLNKVIMVSEKTYQGFPKKEYFNHLASKINIYCDMFLKSELRIEKEKLKKLESQGDTGKLYETVLRSIETIRKRMESASITDEEMLEQQNDVAEPVS